MAAQPTKLFKKPPPRTNEQTVGLFKKRQKQAGVIWPDIDWGMFSFFLGVCVRESIGIGIYSAAGGRGIMLKLYRGKKTPDQDYASTAEEFDELIYGVLDQLGEISDDQEESDVAD